MVGKAVDGAAEFCDEDKAGDEKGFSLGSYDPDYLARFPVALVEAEGQIVAFANLWQAPLAQELSVDLMRHSADAPKGTMDFLFIELFLWGAANGHTRFSLGMAPLSGLANHRLAGRWSRVATLVARHGERFYGFSGLRRFKSKFAPQWRPRYLAAPGGVHLPAALLDATRLAGAKLRRYPHLDPEGALRQLKLQPEGAAMLATDGVFSMDGDQAPLADLALVARAQDALLYVDDAHGIGVLGPEGRGSLAVAGLGAREVPLLLVPLGKAFGGQGAVLLGSKALVGHVAETARPYLFSTAPAPAMAAAMRASLRLIRTESWRRAKLASVVMRFRRGASARGLPLQESFTPIQPIVLGDNASALAAARALEDRGYLVTAIRPPTVPEGQARLRVTLSVDHGEADVDGLLAALSEAVKPASDPVPA